MWAVLFGTQPACVHTRAVFFLQIIDCLVLLIALGHVTPVVDAIEGGDRPFNLTSNCRLHTPRAALPQLHFQLPTSHTTRCTFPVWVPTADLSLIRHAVQRLLSLAAPPYSMDFAQQMLRIIKLRNSLEASHPAVLLSRCHPDPCWRLDACWIWFFPDG